MTKLADRFKLFGQWWVTHERNGVVLSEDYGPNIIVDEGLNHILNVQFNGLGAVNPWRVMIFEGNYTPVAGDTGATFAVAATESVAYAEASRPEYIEVTSTAKSITNTASRATFTMNATKSIYGAALISLATKGATGGTLFAARRFTVTPKVVESGDLLKVGYTVNIA